MAKAAKPEKDSKAFSRGGARPGAGRPRGKRSQKTIELEAKAKALAGDALAALASIAKTGESEGARVSAATAILDRAYGKPRQSLEVGGEGGGPLKVQFWKFGAREVTF